MAAELLVWPVLLAYGEAAVAYAGDVKRPGRFARFATWGVRLGWLAQTALLVVQARSADGFPWSSWSGSLNLFVWLVVGAYLIWGCSPRYRLLGLALMPPAALLLGLSYAAGGTNGGDGAAWSNVFVVLHVGLVLAAFAGFSVAGALAALELWQERLLKRHPAGLLRLRVPSLVALDRLTVTTVAVSLAALTGGIVLGLARLAERGPDLLIAGTLVLWALGAAVLYLRIRAGRREPAAALTLGALGAVVVLQLGLLATHVA